MKAVSSHHAVATTKKPSYKSSRVVELTTPKKSRINPAHTSHKSSPQKKRNGDGRRKRFFAKRFAKECPNAPYNDTSYIIDLQRSDESQDYEQAFPALVAHESDSDLDDILFDFNVDSEIWGFVTRGICNDLYDVCSVDENRE